MARHSDTTLIQFLLAMAVVIIVSIFNWIKRRAQMEEPSEPPPERKVPPVARSSRPQVQTAPSPPRPTPRKVDWEEELRRLLQGDTSPPAAPLPERPGTESAPASSATPPAIPLIRPAYPAMTDQDRGFPVQLPSLTASAESYREASQLDETVAQHMRQVGQQIERYVPPLQARETAQEILQTLHMVRDRQALRSVIMASVILGPPKGLEG